jgi:hypothetical protein
VKEEKEEDKVDVPVEKTLENEKEGQVDAVAETAVAEKPSQRKPTVRRLNQVEAVVLPDHQGDASTLSTVSVQFGSLNLSNGEETILVAAEEEENNKVENEQEKVAETEVKEEEKAIKEESPQPQVEVQPQVQAQAQPQALPQIQAQAQIQPQPQIQAQQAQQAQPQIQAQPLPPQIQQQPQIAQQPAAGMAGFEQQQRNGHSAYTGTAPYSVVVNPANVAVGGFSGSEYPMYTTETQRMVK